MSLLYIIELIGVVILLADEVMALLVFFFSFVLIPLALLWMLLGLLVRVIIDLCRCIVVRVGGAHHGMRIIVVMRECMFRSTAHTGVIVTWWLQLFRLRNAYSIPILEVHMLATLVSMLWVASLRGEADGHGIIVIGVFVDAYDLLLSHIVLFVHQHLLKIFMHRFASALSQASAHVMVEYLALLRSCIVHSIHHLVEGAARARLALSIEVTHHVSLHADDSGLIHMLHVMVDSGDERWVLTQYGRRYRELVVIFVDYSCFIHYKRAERRRTSIR